MGKRFAIVIGVAAAGVMALGTQTAAAGPADVVKYGARVTISHDQSLVHGDVHSFRQCQIRRPVTLFRQRPGADRNLGTDLTRTVGGRRYKNRHRGHWAIHVHQMPDRWRAYAVVTREEGDGYVCKADRSRIYTVN